MSRGAFGCCDHYIYIRNRIEYSSCQWVLVRTSTRTHVTMLHVRLWHDEVSCLAGLCMPHAALSCSMLPDMIQAFSSRWTVQLDRQPHQLCCFAESG